MADGCNYQGAASSPGRPLLGPCTFVHSCLARIVRALSAATAVPPSPRPNWASCVDAGAGAGSDAAAVGGVPRNARNPHGGGASFAPGTGALQSYCLTNLRHEQAQTNPRHQLHPSTRPLHAARAGRSQGAPGSGRACAGRCLGTASGLARVRGRLSRHGSMRPPCRLPRAALLRARCRIKCL